jgi:hypothetical protein
MKRSIRLTLRWHSEQQRLVQSVAEIVRGLDAATQIADGDEILFEPAVSIRSVSGGDKRDCNDAVVASEIRCAVEIDDGRVRVIEGTGNVCNSRLFVGHSNVSSVGQLDRVTTAGPYTRGAA